MVGAGVAISASSIVGAGVAISAESMVGDGVAISAGEIVGAGVGESTVLGANVGVSDKEASEFREEGASPASRAEAESESTEGATAAPDAEGTATVPEGMPAGEIVAANCVIGKSAGAFDDVCVGSKEETGDGGTLGETDGNTVVDRKGAIGAMLGGSDDKREASGVGAEISTGFTGVDREVEISGVGKTAKNLMRKK